MGALAIMILGLMVIFIIVMTFLNLFIKAFKDAGPVATAFSFALVLGLWHYYGK